MESMREFFLYFFGVGELGEFKEFSLAHFLPILIAAGCVWLIWHYREPLRTSRYGYILPWTLAFAMIVCEMSYFWRLLNHPELGLDNPAADYLPITVCGWATIFASYMIVTKSQKLFDIVYFLVFAGSTFALVTPAVIATTGPTRFRYYQFWGEHLLGYLALFYLMFVEKMRPTFRSLIRAMVFMLVLMGAAILANELVGPPANYLFLTTSEDGKSILDILPTNLGLRLLIMAPVLILMFFLAYLPWFIMDRKKAKAAQNTQESAQESTQA